MSSSLSRSLRALRLTPSLRPLTRNASTDPSSSTPSPSSSSTPKPQPVVLPHYPVPRRLDPNTNPSTSTSADRTQHVFINYPHRVFNAPRSEEMPERLGGNEAAEREKLLMAATGLSGPEIRGLRRYTVRVGRVTQMTKKGKMPSFTALVVVGSPTRGLVGIGYGRGATNLKAMDQGFHKAVLSMDYVTRYENRTLWGEGRDLTNKWGATKVLLRARPPGFGLMVPPALHRVFTACGIRDASATIEGSRNSVEVVKCVMQMLHGGANPPGFGSGLSGKGRREDKGLGIRSKEEIERERGRYGVDIGRRV
ncbi:uncharacterized protein MKK02DRAFT_45683 [Dioszegia hungarica]|uniref:S5 DRBM domain-containing protein n=1 Tax=Dioszegia hungarica TaxID=4972 RepID=A0AA38LVA9_9TREE|nr:uncharacterized protein MKK02DRAFT_45683 [Dioszegia hungarica]KAI9636975.1 hypothetical protein MKK02DRAFT_45683 [Dioszegia hungarica]